MPQKDLPDPALPEARSPFNFPRTGAWEALRCSCRFNWGFLFIVTESILLIPTYPTDKDMAHSPSLHMDSVSRFCYLCPQVDFPSPPLLPGTIPQRRLPSPFTWTVAIVSLPCPIYLSATVDSTQWVFSTCLFNAIFFKFFFKNIYLL